MTSGGLMRALLAGAVLLLAGSEGSRAEDRVRSNLSLLETMARATLVDAADSLQLSLDRPVTIVARKPHEANDFVSKLLGRTLAEQGYQVRVALSGSAPEPPPEDPSETSKPRPPSRVNESHPGRQRAREQQATNPDTTGAYADSVAAADPLWGGSQPDPDAADSTGEASSAGEDAGEVQDEEGDAVRSQGTIEVLPGGGALPVGQVVELEILEFGVSYAEARRKLLFGPLRFTRVTGAFFQLSHLHGPEGEVVQVRSAERHVVDDLSSRQRVLVEGASYPFTKPALVPPSLGRYIEPTVVVGIVGSLIYLFYTNQN